MRWTCFLDRQRFHPILTPLIWGITAHFLACSAWGNGFQDQTPADILTVYPASNRPGDFVAVESVTVGELKAGIRRVSTPRPLLLIIDPRSLRRADVVQQVTRISRRIEKLATSADGPVSVYAGFAVLDGVLSAKLGEPAQLRSSLRQFVNRYMPERESTSTTTIGRALDLAASLIERVQREAGSIDVLILAADQAFDLESRTYLSEGMERRFWTLATKRGTTLYGCLKETGAVDRLCRSTGGLVFPWVEADKAAATILELQLRAYHLELDLPGQARAGSFDLTIRTRADASEVMPLRTPREGWSNPAALEIPNHHQMRQALEWIRRAKESAQDQNLTNAIRFADQAIREDPWNPDAYYLAGESAAQMGDWVEAESYLQRSRRIGAAAVPLLLLQARVSQQLREPEEALSRIEESIRAGVPTSNAVRKWQARLLTDLGRNDEGVTLYAGLLGTEEDDAAMRADYGCALWRLDDSVAAAEQLEASLTSAPKNLQALVCSSELSLFRGEIEQAESFAVRALEVSPDHPDTRAQVGAIAEKKNDLDGAIEQYRIALNLAPGRRDLVDRLARVLQSADQVSDSIDLLLRTLEVDRSHALWYRSLAEIYLRTGDLSNALWILEEGGSRCLDEGPAFYREAGELRERRGEFGQAILNYRAMLSALRGEAADSASERLGPHLEYLSLRLSEASGSDPTDATGSKAVSMESAIDSQGLTVPGGLGVLSRTLGLNEQTLRSDDAVGRLFSYILEASPNLGKRLRDDPLRYDVLAYLKHYDDLLKHMRKKKLLPADFDLEEGGEFEFSLLEDGDSFRRTKNLLSFFGIRVKKKKDKKGGSPSVEITMKQNRRSRERQSLLLSLGVNLMERRVADLQFTLKNESLPLILGPDAWHQKILAKKKKRSKYLLGRIVHETSAMRLYGALDGCSKDARLLLHQVATPGELLQRVEEISMFGEHIELSDGRLSFPGSRAAWESHLGVMNGDDQQLLGSLLRRDKGRSLLLYYLLQVAPPSVADYFTASAQRLSNLYELTAAYEPSDRGFFLKETGPQNIGRVLRKVTVDGDGISLPVDARFGSFLLTGVLPEESKENPGGPSWHLDWPSFRGLATQLQGSADQGDRSVVGFLEFLSFVGRAHPENLTDEIFSVVARDSYSAPIFWNLVWDLPLPAEALERYLKYCRKMALDQSRSWNPNRTRTSQSLFHLISLLYREQSLELEDARRLFVGALDFVDVEDESTFASSVAKLLSDGLIPALKASTHERNIGTNRLLIALAGPERSTAFTFNGRRLELDLPEYKLKRMKETIRHQTYARLDSLLKIYDILADSGQAGGSNELRKLLVSLPRAEFPQDASKDAREATAYADLSPFDKWSGAQDQGTALSVAERSQLAEALHVELGVTLLTFCYAYYGSPETDALAFDSNFVRKHRFYPDRRQVAGWQMARLAQDETLGSYMEGSLSSVGFELSRLQTAQSVQSFGRREGKDLVPTMLASMRAMRSIERTDRAQRYVALTVRLGQEILILSIESEDLREWCKPLLAELMAPPRRKQIEQYLHSREPEQILATMSSSEFFVLGKNYLDTLFSGSRDGLPEYHLDCPILAQLRDVIPSAPEDSRRFYREVTQYGPLLRDRMGLNHVSLIATEPYEFLAHTGSKSILYERIFDLKVRLAELNYSLGLPASLEEIQGELALRDILPRSEAVRTSSWRFALERIHRLGPEHAVSWVEELINRGILSISSREDIESGF